jgi:hypothetical protein
MYTSPYWTTVSARVAGRIKRHFRLKLLGYYQSLGNSPPAVTNDTRSLYWNIQGMGSVKLDGNWPNLNGYISYTYQHQRNSGRQTEVNTGLFLAGGAWQITRTVNLFAEYAQEIMTGSIETGSMGTMVSPTLSNFLPDSQTSVVELSWNLPRRVQLSMNYTHFDTSNDNPFLLPDGNTHGDFLTFNANYQFPGGQQIGLVVAPWTYRDKVASGMNYDATVVMVTGSARF